MKAMREFSLILVLTAIASGGVGEGEPCTVA